jgi:WD40 repeat protein
MSEISIKVDNDKLHNNNPHNDKSVTKIEISPNEKYLITYSQEDNSIAGWNVKSSLSLDNILELSDSNDESESNKHLYQISVSDDKEVAFINENKIGKN